MEEKKRILIVEDHPLLRAGLRALLSQEADTEIIGEADNGRDAMLLVATFAPHLALMDLSLPGMNGIEAIVDIKRRYPGTRVLVLTVHKADEYVRESLRAGADGYILKDGTHDELRAAIRSVLSGKTYLSSEISTRVANGYLDIDSSPGRFKGFNIYAT